MARYKLTEMAYSGSIPQALDTFRRYSPSKETPLRGRWFSLQGHHSTNDESAKSVEPGQLLVIDLSVHRQQNDLVADLREIVLNDAQAMVAIQLL